MKNHLIKSLLAVGLLAFSFAVSAEDIDLFVGSTPTELPNVMLVMDNGANFSSSAAGQTCIIDGVATALSGTVGGIEQCALYKVISDLDVTTPTINLGMMVYNASNIRDISGSNCGGSGAKGSCLIVPLMTLNSANKTTLLAWIKSWKTTGGAGSGYIKASSGIGGNASAMQESWAYFAGKTGLSGRNYLTIKPAASCQKNYIIFIGNSYSSSGKPGDAGGPQAALEGTAGGGKDASPAATAAQKAILTTTLVTSCGSFTFPSSSHESKGFYADEWARYLLAQNVRTYTVGVLGSSCQAEYAALLTNMAAVGGGKYYPTTDYTQLVDALKGITSEIQSVNSVFASVSLPVSVNTQGTYLNQVFVGMFRPTAEALPRWNGNLKQYKLGYVSGALKLVDADDLSAISASGSGFIAECGRSFWTPLKTATDTYWGNLTEAGCIGYDARSNTPDGNFVEKGAQGYKLRATTPASRIVKTCSPVYASCTTLTDFNTGNAAITQTLMDSTSGATNRDDLINWSRGLNNKGDETFVASTAMRPSVHGDVVHSRPVAINFGTDLVPQVVVFYGGNDGLLRAVNGNRSTAIGSVTAGSELWSFMPPEFYSKIKRIRNNTSLIGYGASPTDLRKDYGFDGPMAAYKDTTNAWIYAGMRRGGRTFYAFNVDVSTPANITLKWKKGCPNAGDDTGCSAGFAEMGQTWSSPKVLKSAGYGAGASPMIILGGGYDPCEDYDALTAGGANHNCATTKGNRIYVMDANTGTSLKTFNTDRGVIGDITIVPDSVTGLAKYAYAVDLGGNVYRISGASANSPIGSTLPGSWTITKIASLGCATTATCTANRKFMFAPDVVEENGIYYLLLGSGDREKPLANYAATASVTNYFFMIKDTPTDTTWLSSETSNCGGASIICKNSLLDITSGVTPTQTQLDSKPKGWALGLMASEQVVTSAVTIYGTVTFSTHQPTPPLVDACASLGTARVYNLKYLNAASANGTSLPYEDLAGDGLPPSPVAGLVTLDDGTTVPFVIGANANSPLEVKPPPPPPPGTAGTEPKSRVYWYIQK